MERYDLVTARKVGDKTYWTKVGVMFPQKDGRGFRLSFEALPVPSLYDGKLEVTVMAFPPKEQDEAPRGRDRAPARQSGPDDGEAIPF